MKRRGFFGALFASAAAPLVAKAGSELEQMDLDLPEVPAPVEADASQVGMGAPSYNDVMFTACSPVGVWQDGTCYAPAGTDYAPLIRKQRVFR